MSLFRVAGHDAGGEMEEKCLVFTAKNYFVCAEGNRWTLNERVIGGEMGRICSKTPPHFAVVA